MRQYKAHRRHRYLPIYTQPGIDDVNAEKELHRFRIYWGGADNFMGSAETLLGGLLGLMAAAGVGSGLTRLLGPIPGRWRLATSLVAGVAVFDLCLMLVLFLGGGVRSVKIVGVGAILIGGCLLLWSLNRLRSAATPAICRNADRWFLAVIVAAIAINLLIAVAPSTKIDELHYHMLIPKRVMEDGGLHLYHRPYEAAIFPQNGFQLGLSAAHAAGIPEAGNVVSWGLGVALILLVAGVTSDLTGSATAGWMTGAICAVGLYPAVWHVTSGPHALGDLATVTACLLALLPDDLTGEMKAQTKLFLVCLTAYAAASTKISILPLSVVFALIGVRRAAAKIGWKIATGMALGVWTVFYGPIILWTTLKCGSPFGLATASMFHSHYFGPEDIAELADSGRANQQGWMPLLAWMVPSVSVGLVAAFGVVAFAAWKRGRVFKILFGLVCGQAMLIAWLLPHQFRFLGGLQYAVLVLGAWVAWPSRLGARLIARWWVVLLGMCLPWLAVQAYYAKPFIKVDLGTISRDSFLHSYVAFAEDFRVLNRVLPADAVIYVVNSRLPSYYAPRPVIYTLEDLKGREPLYRFTVGPGAPPLETSLSCTATVYVNSSAISVVYRTPGLSPVREPLKVEHCVAVRGARPDS
jgi:hypothetical protein